MKHFRRNIVLLTVSIVVLTAVSTILFSNGLWAQGVLAAIVLGVAAAGLAVLVRKLIRVMSTFVRALEMKDSSMRFDVGQDDRELRAMSESINRISELYMSNSQELETKKLYYDRILRIMTHEMRNSITPVISLSTDMLDHKDRYMADENYAEAVGVIREQSMGIKRFLDSYYELTHLPKPEKENVMASEFFDNIAKIFRFEAKERGMDPEILNMSVPADMILNIDKSLMHQVFVNIIRNALDAVSGRSDAKVDILVSISEGVPYMTIEDNGPGLPAKVEEDIFQPFMTTKPGGSGIGLFLSRQIVRLHGGELRISNLSKGGVRVSIMLPEG